MQTRAHLTLILECCAQTIRLSGSLTERTATVHGSGTEVVGEMKIGSTLRLSACKTAWAQVSDCGQRAAALPSSVMLFYQKDVIRDRIRDRHTKPTSLLLNADWKLLTFFFFFDPLGFISPLKKKMLFVTCSRTSKQKAYMTYFYHFWGVHWRNRDR